MRRLCVFCGASPGARADYAELARALGRETTRRGVAIVYGGASVGTMGALADAALAHGGEVIGVIPRALVEREIAHGGLSELHVVETLFERKRLMLELSDAFVALPGGLGTLDELFEVVTWSYLNLHDKPVALLDGGGYWSSLNRFLDQAAAEGFVAPAWAERLRPHKTLDELFEGLVSCPEYSNP